VTPANLKPSADALSIKSVVINSRDRVLFRHHFDMDNRFQQAHDRDCFGAAPSDDEPVLPPIWHDPPRLTLVSSDHSQFNPYFIDARGVIRLGKKELIVSVNDAPTPSTPSSGYIPAPSYKG